jgi:hypothetical protein
MTLEEILNGIDTTECESDAGWWETSDGAKFGARKLQEVTNLFRELEKKISQLEERQHERRTFYPT